MEENELKRTCLELVTFTWNLEDFTWNLELFPRKELKRFTCNLELELGTWNLKLGKVPSGIETGPCIKILKIIIKWNEINQRFSKNILITITWSILFHYRAWLLGHGFICVTGESGFQAKLEIMYSLVDRLSLPYPILPYPILRL